MLQKFRNRASSGNLMIYNYSIPSLCGRKFLFLLPHIPTLSTLKKGSDFSADREINLLSEASRSVNFWTPPLRHWRLHSSYDFDFYGVGLDAPFYDHASQQLTTPYTEDTFLRVQFESMFAQGGEGLAEV